MTYGELKPGMTFQHEHRTYTVVTEPRAVSNVHLVNFHIRQHNSNGRVMLACFYANDTVKTRVAQR
jgi:hypothetical protein